MCFEIGFPDFKIIFPHMKTINPMIDLGIADGIGKIDLFQCITKLEGPRFRVHFITRSGLECLMLALFGFLQLAKYFFQ